MMNDMLDRLVPFSDFADAVFFDEPDVPDLRVAVYSAEQSAEMAAILRQFRETGKGDVGALLVAKARLLRVAPHLDGAEVSRTLWAYGQIDEADDG